MRVQQTMNPSPVPVTASSAAPSATGVAPQRPDVAAPPRLGSVVLDGWIDRMTPATKLEVPELGAAFTGPGALEALRKAFPDLRITHEKTFVDVASKTTVLQLRLSGTFAGDLGSLRKTGKKVEGLAAFARFTTDDSGRVVSAAVRIDPGLALHQLGYVGDPRKSSGRLGLIARKSLLTAAGVAASALWERAKKKLAGREAPVPATTFIPDPTVQTPRDAVLRHFNSETDGSAKKTLETMSDHGIEKEQIGNAEFYAGRDAMYRHYAEAFAGLAGVFTPTFFADGPDRQVYVEYVFKGTHAGSLGGVAATHRPADYKAWMVFDVAADLSIRKETSYAAVLPILAKLELAEDPATPAGLARLTR